jgi:HK97 family phage major capsid protein
MKLNTLSLSIAAGLLIFNDAVTLDELNDKLINLKDAAKNIQAKADAEKRPLTEDEEAEITKIFDAFEATEAEIDRRKNIAGMEARLTEGRGRQTDPEGGGGASDEGAASAANAGGGAATTRAQNSARQRRGTAAEAIQDVGKWGFRSAGEYLMAVKNASQRGAQPDPRLIANAAPGSYGSEGVGADGGFAVPPDFRSQIVTKIMGEDSLLSSTDQMQSSSNAITFPVDETTPWQSAGGIQAYWDGEAGLKTASKPALKEVTVKLAKLIALVPLTDELLEDAPAMAAYVNRKAPEKINWKLNDAIFNGTGAGQMLGILNSSGTVVVAPESGQVADTFNFHNALKLYTSVTPSARSRAKWYMNPDIEQQLIGMSFRDNNTYPTPVYLPAGTVAGQPFSTLFGRPVVFTEACKALGDKGDVVFGDLGSYLSVVKTGGIRSDVSIHLWFDYDITAFRFVLRVGGQPWWNAKIDPAHQGSSPRGFFATLADRT